MSDLLSVGCLIAWTFPGTHHVYHGVIVEQCPAEKEGDEERYRIRGSQFDCFAFRRDMHK